MIHEQIKFECLTPCFCAGANHFRAEIRPSAIRGALRWWFRTLGGTPEEETGVFGGSQPVRASAIQVRVSDLSQKATGQLPSVGKGKGKLGPTDPLAYILYFASISGGEGANFGQGPRWNENGSIGPGTTFTLHLRQLRQVPEKSLSLLTEAIEAFRHYGSIGLRVTRGLGALQAGGISRASKDELDRSLKDKGFAIKDWNRPFQDWQAIMAEAGRILKNDLRGKYGAGGNKKPAKATALGGIKPVRQTSALYLRPRKLDGQLFLSAYEAPHGRVLGERSRRSHSKSILDEL